MAETVIGRLIPSKNDSWHIANTLFSLFDSFSQFMRGALLSHSPGAIIIPITVQFAFFIENFPFYSFEVLVFIFPCTL